MNLNLTEKTRDVEAILEQLTMINEEIFLSLHKKNFITKESLRDIEHLRLFIEDYHHMLDNLCAYNIVLK